MPLDTSAYDALVLQHALMGIARREGLLEWLDEDAWTVDVERATFTVEDRGTFPMRLLGTYSHESRTFLWSWANDAISAVAPKAYATSLRDHAMKAPGLAPFTERKLAAGWVGHEELVAVVSNLAGLPSFEGTYGAGTACILVEGVPPPEEISPMLAKTTLMKGFAAIMVQDAPKLVSAFLTQAGYTVTRAAETRIEAKKGSYDGLSVEWPHGFERLPEVWID